MDTQHANITEHGALIVEYLKSMQEKIKTSNKIPIEQVKKIIRVSIEYAEATCRSSILVQMWQKLKCIEFLAKEQSQQQNSISDKLIVLKKQQVATIASPKPQT